ncbi:MarR family winged helix-turn-helix transcriptional regulator [Dysgonomonas macrotermitis]|uniref:Transcriptional regulator, MarR family n=1 Tax=Dysgonomonas macrotermitis TaxID=1346286 RepID=A0A1M5BR73_9BACT|nr:MarR family winged helix-turn-helix transcriptional regulator [Dysgonomonas macrotermitis]SHF44945.1 transcriptional regulator, MarR family [Dysgonomonas macrotermitis]
MINKKADKPDEQLGYLLTQVTFLKQRIVNAALRELDITYIQFIILAGTMELGSEDTMVTQQMISDERRLDKAMVSNVVKSLVEKGLMVRDIHPTDKRAYILSLTEKGIEKALKGKEKALMVDETFFSAIDKEKLQEALVILLKNDLSQS